MNWNIHWPKISLSNFENGICGKRSGAQTVARLNTKDWLCMIQYKRISSQKADHFRPKPKL